MQGGSGVPQWEEWPPLPSAAALPSTVAIAAGMISTVVAVYLAKGAYPDLEDQILTLDTRTMRFAYNRIRSRADCLRCATRGARAVDNDNLQMLVSPITGIVSGMEVSDRDAAGFFHANAWTVRPKVVSPRTPMRPLGSIGRGLTQSEAMTTCVGEATERYCSLYQGTENLIRARIHEIDAVAPNDTLLFSDAQYGNRLTWNSRHSELHWVPHRFDPDYEIEWTPARSLASDRLKYFPAGNCLMDFPFTKEIEFCSADTNGCAAGRTRPEAILKALLELIERDSVAIWWYNRLSRPAAELASFGDSRLLGVQKAFAREGLDLYLLDVTTDLGIPAYVAVAPAPDGSKPYFGSAAHFSPRDAALRAASEAAQVWFWMRQGAATPELTSWLETATLNRQEYLRPRGTIPAKSVRTTTAEENIVDCVNRLRIAGIEPYCVDLTRPEVGVPTVRVLAPGLRHFWARLAPGRLYDVPVRMGWLNRAHTEAELNPIPCMI
jgi:ribosomal protein S12 methylthiotransferase accessory factor